MTADAVDREHPTAEKLSAYEADELSLEESEAVREHVAGCGLCEERLADLRRFLELAPEEREGVADLETAAEWRKLRNRLEKEPEWTRAAPSPVSSGGFFRSARGGYATAAAFFAIAVALGLWNLSLVRRSREPVVVRTVSTLSAEGSLRGPAEPAEGPVVLPAQINLELPVETPDPLYRVDLVREGSRLPERSLEVPPQETELRFLLPEKALRPGKYVIHAQGLRDGKPSSEPLSYGLTVAPSGP